MKILNIGSLNIDKTYAVKHFAKPGETIKAQLYKEYSGGKGLNQSIALARAGAEVYHAGKVGEDGEKLCRTLKDSTVDIRFVEKVEKTTGHAIIQINEEGQNNIIIVGGANEEVSKEYIEQVLSAFQEGDILLLQNEVSNVDFAIQMGKKRGMKIVFNPSPLDNKVSKYPLQDVDFFVLNEIEAVEIIELSTKEEGKRREYTLGEIEQSLKNQFSGASFVLTLGEKGSMYFDGKCRISQKAFKTKVVDTTGAGDTFCGYFIAGMTKKFRLEKCLKIASAAASLSVSRKGASPSIPLWGEVESFLKTNDQ